MSVNATAKSGGLSAGLPVSSIVRSRPHECGHGPGLRLAACIFDAVEIHFHHAAEAKLPYPDLCRSTGMIFPSRRSVAISQILRM